jgi:hypothetical protein
VETDNVIKRMDEKNKFMLQIIAESRMVNDNPKLWRKAVERGPEHDGHDDYRSR